MRRQRLYAGSCRTPWTASARLVIARLEGIRSSSASCWGSWPQSGSRGVSTTPTVCSTSVWSEWAGRCAGDCGYCRLTRRFSRVRWRYWVALRSTTPPCSPGMTRRPPRAQPTPSPAFTFSRPIGSSTSCIRSSAARSTSRFRRSSVLYELGVAEATDRQSADFDLHLREAMALTAGARDRAQIALHLGRALAGSGNFRASIDVLDEALRGLADPDDDLGIALEAELLAMTHHEFTATELAAPRWERRFAQLDAGEDLDPLILASLVWAVAAKRGPAETAIALADRALRASRLDEPNSVLSGCLCNGLIYAGSPSRAARLYDETIATARRRGSRLTVAWQMMMRGDASLRLGEIRRAEAEARFGFDHFKEAGGEPGLAWTVAHVLDALVVRGALEEADEFADANAVGPGAPPTLPQALLHSSLARLHVARGRASAALTEARAAGDLASATISNPICVGWREPAALALAALDRGDEARALAEGALADARRLGIPNAVGSALRTLGLVVGGADGVEGLRASVDTLERAEGRLEHARAMLELGAALRRLGERVEARNVLREALDMTARLGASGLADRAHEELVAAGARPRRDRRMLSGRESLTASEDRVAALAAEGLTNREIAQRQFVTVKAVEWHLRNVYRKLDIGSRDQLAEALAV